MPKREDNLLLDDILENAANIFEFSFNKTYDQFISDKMRVLAVIRCFEVIGEAVNLVSEELKSKYPLIEWRMMSDFRNILIHNYFGIDYEVLWQIIQEDLPQNYDMLKKINT